MSPKRKRMSSDFVLALAALLISFVIWLIAAEADIESDNLTVPIEVTSAPGNYKIDILPKDAIVTIQYPKTQKSSIIAPNFTVVVDVNNIPEFVRRDPEISTTWLLTSVDVQKRNVSDRVKVIDIAQPKHIAIQAKMFIDDGEIKPMYSGELKAGFRLAERPTVRPERLKVTGPPSLLANLKQQNNGKIILRTTNITITGEDRTFSRTVKVTLPEGLQLVNPNEEFVDVIFGVTETEESKVIRHVPIEIKTFTQNVTVNYTPREATVEVKVPTSSAQEISAKDIYCEPVQPLQETAGFQGKVAIEAKFRENVAKRIKEKATFVSVDPESVEVTVKQQKPK